MSITCFECYDSPTGTASTSPTADIHVRVNGTWNKFDAYEAVMSFVAERKYENNCQLDSVKIQPIEGADAWDGFAHYSMRRRDAGDSFDYQFTTTGGSSHINRSFKTYVARSCINNMPVINYRNGIGWSDGRFEGVDIPTPSFTWSQSVCWPLAMIGANYKTMLARYTCCVNDSPFAGFAPGEVRFDGVTNGSIISDFDEDTNSKYYYYKLTYSFSAMPNMHELKIGDSGTFTKRGWDYMWLTRCKVDDKNSGNSIMVPRQVNVEQVYPYVNLNALGLDFAMFLNLLHDNSAE